MKDVKGVNDFALFLIEDEKSRATVAKYMHDVRNFLEFARGRRLNKPLVIEYKERLQSERAASGVNSVLSSINSFFRFCGRGELCVRLLRVQSDTYCAEERELSRKEYMRLVRAAREAGNERLELILQTVCGTGIRVSELSFITAEAAHRGEATVSCKGKTRRVFIVKALQKRLIAYCRKIGLKSGPVFVTRSGRAVDRSNVWREMKGLCLRAGVQPGKVFPHNLRHLFARTFYGAEKDIVKLADILGHSSINTTRIYPVTTGAEHRRRMENMRLII